MKPKKIILIRHGKSEGNENPAIYIEKPDYALELSETGLKQADDAGKELLGIVGNERVMFYISPFFRTRSTFERIARQLPRSQFDYREEPRLREQEWGHLRSVEENKQIDAERDRYGTFYYRFPDGESCADVYDRVSDFFGTLYRDFSKDEFPENTVVITHGMTIRLFLMKWLKWSVEDFETYSNPYNCQSVILQRNDYGKYELISTLIRRPAKHNFQRPILL